MVRTLAANQQTKVNRPYAKPVYLIKITPATGDPMYFSDRNITYGGINYEAYLKNLDTIGEQVRNLGGYDNHQLTLEFLNTAYRGDDYLITYFDTNVVEKHYLEIWKLFLEVDETTSSDTYTKIFKGEVGNPYDITENCFSVDIQSMLFGVNAELPFSVIDTTTYPNCDPDDVGRTRNIIYGSLTKVYCPLTIAGWVSTLAEDVDIGETNIEVSGSHGHIPIPPAGGGVYWTMVVDTEDMTVTAVSGNYLTVSRTASVTHLKGATVYVKPGTGYPSHVLDYFEAEVAAHPVKSISAVYGRKSGGPWLRAISGYTAYTSSGGRAFITFTDKIKWQEADADYSLSQTTNHAFGSDTHLHSASATPSQYSVFHSLPTSTDAGGTNPRNCIDGSTSSYTGMASGTAKSITFGAEPPAGLGTIAGIYYFLAAGSGDWKINGVTIAGSGLYPPEWKRLWIAGGTWAGSCTVTAPTPYGGSFYEIYRDVYYTPSIGVSIGNTGSADNWTAGLSGNSVCNFQVADEICADVSGYEDDASGTYTGTAYALIQRPDHVRKHILIALLGFSASDLDLAGTWATTGSQYNSRGYNFAFVMHEVAKETMKLFEQMDLQSRSTMFEGSGIFKLNFMSTSDPTSQKTFDADNIKGLFTFGKTEVADLRNKLTAHYYRDYTESGDLADKYQKVYSLSDATSISKYGTQEETLEFSCIGNLEAMVDDVLDWILIESKELKKTVNFTAFWDASLIEGCDYFTVHANFYSTVVSPKKFKTLKLVEHMDDQTIDIEGLEFTSS